MSLALRRAVGREVRSVGWGPTVPVFPVSLQVVVLCFAVAFGSFFQGYGPYPSATKMALPSQQEPYTASVGKTARRAWEGSVSFLRSLPKAQLSEGSHATA